MPADSYDATIEAHRSNLEGLAYRMLGSWADAQDIAQETLVKWHRLAESVRSTIREPLAWLHTVASRLSLDRLKSAQRRRESYVGPWLPEPLLTTDETPAEAASIDDSITLALLHAMERLSPSERAAFILHDVFDYSFKAVADILQKEPATCRQLASRARKSIRSQRPAKSPVDPNSHQRLLAAFLQAASQGDAQTLEQLLAADAILYSDGGAKAKAVRKPLRSRELIVRLHVGLARKAQKSGQQNTVRFTQLNQQPAALVYTDGFLSSVFSIEIQDGKIQTLYMQRNPDKLRHLSSAVL
ncbi:RNA polymerase sigma factor SigJ [Pelagicoccus sp. NFK12]|uniref:RNA polymerase sigma factor SigJ n=1 Tax=Pelagicoccus enzymogenes TaxID=2773457 RepID=A0A927IIT8_9BACT|nr:RNA polymerase sigma factor SigJ [Pelagicoccus enzymogenes]MBD5781108.1 RNA polymerase sigma factor SigJ [Pelagicoccus enzymogenes]